MVYFQTPSHLREEDTRFELNKEDLVTPTQEPSVQRLESKEKICELLESIFFR